MIIEINEFPTHIAKTNNKVAPDKMIKINNQSIYNSNLNRFARNIVMKNMHDYLKSKLEPYLEVWLREQPAFPICVNLEIHVPKNYGNVRMIKGKLSWKLPSKNYAPNWDVENLASIWMKALNDVLTDLGFIPDDNVEYIACVGYDYKEVKDLKDRKLIIKLDED